MSVRHLKLSARARSIGPSPTLAMNKRAAELRALGLDILPLSLGEPDFDTPPEVKLAGIRAIEQNLTKYTAADGSRELKAAIIRKLSRENGMKFDASGIVVGSGAKLVLLAALLSIVDPGDEVLVPAPYWVSYPDLITLADGVPRFVASSEVSGFKIDHDSLARSLSEKTRALILNSPNNPSGAVYSAAEMRDLADALAAHPDIWVITDEIYEHHVFDGRTSTSFARVAPELRDRTITVNGFSKGYVMTGWRLGFAAAEPPVIGAMADLLSQMHGSPSSIAQVAAVEALDGDQSFIPENRKVLQRRRDLVIQRVHQMPGFSALQPEGTFYAFLGCSALIGRTSGGARRLESDVDVVEALLDEAGVAAVPGTAFGMSPFVRVSFALRDELLDRAMDRMDAFARAVT